MTTIKCSYTHTLLGVPHPAHSETGSLSVRQPDHDTNAVASEQQMSQLQLSAGIIAGHNVAHL